MTDLDEFRLIRPLGKGGMGMVYLAHDTVLDRRVAIKLIATNDPDATSRDRFLTEARAVARLSHPNVVSIYRVGTTADGRPYLVQELVGGTSLDRVPRPINWRRVCELALGVTRGLAAAHRSGILHRDIKPGNVMLDDKGVVRILDFGLAKLAGQSRAPAASTPAMRARDLPDDPDATRDPDHSTDLATSATRDDLERISSAPRETAAGALIGTPRYLAPELWRGEPATVRSDLYALGVMLYELLTGSPPFPEQQLAELEQAVLTRAPPRPDAIAVDVPGWLADIVERCIQRVPTTRWESAEELAHAIEQGLSGGPPIPEGNPYRGLEHFDASHRSVFFGRHTDTQTIVDRLRTESMVVLAGDSGTGKSSLCRAGVLPAITGGAFDARQWRALVVSPGRRPMATLAAALRITEERAVDELVRMVIPRADDGLLLFVDQCEELITVADRDEAERAGQLLAALSDGFVNVRVLLAVRGDFLTRVAALPALSEPMTRGLQLLRALSAADVREAIVGPARVKGSRLESEEMIDELVDSVAHSPGALPSLQFTLAELWDARAANNDTIRHSALVHLGGVAGALARHADRVLLSLGASERDAARRILVRLVSTSGTRISRSATELVDGNAASIALEALVRGRLVAARDTTDEPSYELAHEALITSWGTLRAWLEDQAGHRVLMDRLTTAAAAWRADGRKRDLLWSQRQLQGTDLVPDLGEREREFLVASRRHTYRTRLIRLVVLAALPLVALATWLVLHANSEAERARRVSERVVEAAEARRRADASASLAERERAAAFAAFDARHRDDGEAAWDRAAAATSAARTAYRAAAAELEMALAIDASRKDVRAAMAALLDAHALLAEAARDHDAASDLVARLAAYDPDRAARWHAPGVVEVSSGPTVQIEIYPVTDDHGHARLAPRRARGIGALTVELPAGSYVVTLTGPDGLVVRAPILLHRGSRRTVAVPVPARSSVPAGFLYIPAGEFLIGTDRDDFMRRDFLSAAPMHETRTESYLIGRTEVTFAEWIEYLDALPPQERARRTPGTRGGSRMVGGLERDGDGWSLRLQVSDVEYRARPDEPLRYPGRDHRATVRWQNLPVIGVDLDDARAYASWLARTGRVPGARLCNEREWERAARGADGRPYPHGRTVEPDDANLDWTYGREPLAFGPDEVGAHPASDSPFGAADMLGNVWEWVEGEDGPQTRGGGWYYGVSSALSTNRDAGDPGMRELTTGLRLCANAVTAR